MLKTTAYCLVCEIKVVVVVAKRYEQVADFGRERESRKLIEVKRKREKNERTRHS